MAGSLGLRCQGLDLFRHLLSPGRLAPVPRPRIARVSSPVLVAPSKQANLSWGGQRCRQSFCSSVARMGTVPSSPSEEARTTSANASGYRQPPVEILKIVDAPTQPTLSFSPNRKLLLQLDRPPTHPPVYEIARPELKLAGLRIDAEQCSRSRMSYYTGISIVDATVIVPAPSDQCRPVVGHPAGSWINYVSWNTAGTHIAYTIRSAGGPEDPPRKPLELWVAEVETGQARCLLESPTHGLNTIFDDYAWLDENTIVACVLPNGQGPAPQKPPYTRGPKIQDNSSGRKAQVRTYPDLLKDEFDEQLFLHYGASELLLVDIRTGKKTQVGPPRMYIEVDPSPDGRYLLVSWLEPPFSLAVPCGRFPKRVQLWTRDGSFVREVAYLPLAEDIPIAFNSCRKGPRGVSWRDDKGAELYWVECQDEGDPAKEASPRDIVYTLPADSAAQGDGPVELARTDLRCGGVAWCDGELALLYESWYKTRRSVIWIIKPDDPESGKKVLFDRNYEDVYTDPGSPATRRTAYGTYVLAKVDGERKFLMQGTGASPEGNRPFLDLLDLDTGETKRLWQSKPPFFEAAGSIMNDVEPGAPLMLEGLEVMLSRESVRDPPQTYIMTLRDEGKTCSERQITNYPHPYPDLRDLQKEVIRYDREDGVTMTATLYLPPGYDKDRDGPLPCIVWAYPREYKSKDAAGQMRRSPHQFDGIGSLSPTLWLSRGYAVLDGPTFPIIAEGDAEPNDTYIEQLVASARAAVEELKGRGVVDPSRISVGGHSYGSFMAANLLAHAPDLFSAAIARSGAYNRTLTPFGFQNEERTLWQAPETYLKMSPFMAADKVKKPLLLIHGEEDNNTGTYPMQSERFYQALKGHGATCRLVILPHEGHGYRGRESVLHTLYEQDQWLEKYAGYGRVEEGYGQEGNGLTVSESSDSE